MGFDPVAAQPSVADISSLAFYRRHFGSVLLAVVLLAIVNGALLAWHIFSERRSVNREYFAVDLATGQMVRMVPLGDPVVSDQQMLARLQECVVGINSYDFVNFKSTYQGLSDCFTDDGWNAFAQALDAAGTLKSVRRFRLVAQAIPQGVPVVTQTPTRRSGVLTWVVEMPIRVSYVGGEGSQGLSAQDLVVTLTVQRVAQTTNSHGFAISQYLTKEVRR